MRRGQPVRHEADHVGDEEEAEALVDGCADARPDEDERERDGDPGQRAREQREALEAARSADGYRQARSAAGRTTSAATLPPPSTPRRARGGGPGDRRLDPRSDRRSPTTRRERRPEGRGTIRRRPSRRRAPASASGRAAHGLRGPPGSRRAAVDRPAQPHAGRDEHDRERERDEDESEDRGRLEREQATRSARRSRVVSVA